MGWIWWTGLALAIGAGVFWWVWLFLARAGAPRMAIPLLFALACLGAFVAVGAMATSGRAGAVDGALRGQVAAFEGDVGPVRHHHAWALHLEVLAHWKVELVLLGLALAAAPPKLRWRLLPWVAAFAGVGLTALMCKNATLRARPPDAVKPLSDFAFPSGHASITLVFLTGVAVELGRGRRWPARTLVAIACTAGTILVSFSRLVIRAHWPTDVIGGLLLGAFWAGCGTIEAAGHRASKGAGDAPGAAIQPSSASTLP